MTTSPPPDRAAGPATDPAPGAADGPRLGAVVAMLAAAALLASGVAAVGVGRELNGVSMGAPAPAGPAAPHHAAVGVASEDGYAVWDRNDDGRPIRWDPCTPIELVVAVDDAPYGFHDDLARAVAIVAEHTGLPLAVAGGTDERPNAGRAAYQRDRYGERWAPVLVAWARPHEHGLSLRDTDRGLAIPVAVGRPGARVYVTGQVVLNADRDDLRAGFDDRADGWGATLLHELGHLVGLAHVDDPEQLMSVHPGTGPVTLGEGDRAGLAAVGAGHGCLDVPAPRTVAVRERHGR